jgi:Matrixin/Putative Ig domain
MFSMSRQWPAVLGAISLLLAGSASRLFGYALTGPVWPTGSTINEHLALTGPSSGRLQDGFATFNASATDALILWNQQMDLVHLNAIVTGIPGTKGDGQNTAFFSSNVYGMSFGPGTLAITVFYYDGSVMKEADNVFNSAILWDSYRGPLQYNSKKKQYVIDFHRVALHEFGHTLGLDHPDEAGQSVVAIMNSQVSDLDHLADDDIAAITFLYKAAITSPSSARVALGSPFSYQVVANFSATQFSVSSLPSGLNINTQTGAITGIPDLSGDFNLTINASDGVRKGHAGLTISVSPPVLGTLIADISTPIIVRLLLDPSRNLIFGSDQFNSILVFDPATASIDKTIAVPGWPFNMALSPDRSRLYAANSRDAKAGISVVDLSSLQLLTTLPTVEPDYERPWSVAFLDNNDLFVASTQSFGQELDPNTGAIKQEITLPVSTPRLLTNDTRTVMYAVGTNGSHTVARFTVSNGVLTKTNSVIAVDYLKANSDSSAVYSYLNTDVIPPLAKLDGNDLHTIFVFPRTNGWGPIALSGDNAVLYQVSNELNSVVNVFDTATGSSLGSFLTNTPRPEDFKDAALDSSGQYLFLASGWLGANGAFGQVRVFETNRANRSPTAAYLPRTLVNVSTRALVTNGDNVEIGGFILKGAQPKKVIVRAIGPSLMQFGISGAMADPTLELHDSTGAIVATNNNWNTHRTDVLTTGHSPTDEHECAIVATLMPGSYTAILRGLNGSSGIALFELYDIDPQNSTIANISTRGNVGIGDNVMIGGFVIGGSRRTRVMVRALGPTLTDFELSGVLADPTLELHDRNGVLISQNDNWKSTQQLAIQNSGYAPANDAEAAIVATLQPGNYTAIVRGANNSTGVALVEVYNLDTN